MCMAIKRLSQSQLSPLHLNTHGFKQQVVPFTEKLLGPPIINDQISLKVLINHDHKKVLINYHLFKYSYSFKKSQIIII